MKKWEYHTVKLATTSSWLSGGHLDEAKLDEYMNKLGEQGWELVAAFDTNKAYGESKDVAAIFKREV